MDVQNRCAGGFIVVHDQEDHGDSEGGSPMRQRTGLEIANMSDAPRIFPRVFWLAQPPVGELDDLCLPVTRVVVCHTMTELCNTTPECKYLIRCMQDFHIECRGWSDIAYNFVIGGDGNIYTGRGWDKKAAHTKGHNDSLGIAFIGVFNAEMPNTDMIEAFHKLVAIGVKAGMISSQYSLVGQCQLTQTCSPGLVLAKDMMSWPHYDTKLPLKFPDGVGHVGV